MRSKLTADTITDEQIRELRAELKQEDWYDKKGPRTWARVALCNSALAGGDAHFFSVVQFAAVYDARQRARARCAELWNARAINNLAPGEESE